MRKTLLVAIFLVVSAISLRIARLGQAELDMVQIQIGDFYFKPNTIRLRAGHEVKIELTNKGKIEHEFMVGRKITENEESKSPIEMGMHNEREVVHGPNEGAHNLHSEVSKRFEKDFFEGIRVFAQTGDGAEFMKVPGHGTMVRLKPESRATIAFIVPANREGEWQMGCFMPGHYEGNMKGEIIIK